MLVEFSVSIGYGSRKEKVEFPDETTEQEIEEALVEWCNNFVDSGYKILE